MSAAALWRRRCACRTSAAFPAAKAAIERFRESGELGALTCARNHGFCGDWIQNLDTSFERDPEPQPPSPEVGPDWMPKPFIAPYLGYLQQYTHNVNLLRWLL